jgi:hypothetical protein
MTLALIRPSTVADAGGTFARATTATYVDRDGALKTAAANIPRFDYNAGTGSLLIEAAGTNLLTASECAAGLADLSNYTSGVAAGAFTGLTGTTGIVWTALPVTASVGVLKAFADTAGVTYTLSVFVRMADGGAPVCGAIQIPGEDLCLTPNNGTPTAAHTVRAIGGGLYRVSVSFVSTGNGQHGVAKYPGQSARNFSVSGFQLEAGATATSYIATTTVAVTRAADVATGTGLLYSNIPEPATGDTPDPATWLVGTTYALAARASYDHLIYASLTAGNVGNTPSSSPLSWAVVGATNRWRMFDQRNTSQSSIVDRISTVLRPGGVLRGLALLNVSQAAAATVSVIDPVEGVVYSRTTSMQSPPSAGSWYEYFFDAISSRSSLILTDLPSYRDALIGIQLQAATVTDVVAVGVAAVGSTVDIGQGVQFGVRLGIQDYSRKEVNAYGDYEIQERAFSRRATFDVLLDSDEVDSVAALLTTVRATPCVWIGDGEYESTALYGFFKTFDISIKYQNQSQCYLALEGLT